MLNIKKEKKNLLVFNCKIVKSSVSFSNKFKSFLAEYLSSGFCINDLKKSFQLLLNKY
jgi:hypothetical protein